MYMSSWDKSSLESYKAKCEKLEKENEKYIMTFSSLYDNDRQYTKNIKEQEDLIETMSDQLVEEKNNIKIKQMTISELEECLRKKDFENEHLKSKVVDFTTELKSVNESLNLSVKELSKARALVEATLRDRYEMINAQCEKMQLLEEQCEPFYEVQSEFDSEKVHDTQDNSEKDLIMSLQTQLKETAEAVRFSDEKYCALKEIESLKVEIKSLQTENKISNQEMKQKIILFEEDKRMLLAKNEFLEKVFSSVQKEYNDLLISNDVLKQKLETKFKFSKHDTSLEKMIEMIENEYESSVSKISITSSTFETKNLKLVKEMRDKVKCFDDEKTVFETQISNLEKVLTQRVKDFDDVKTELSKRSDKFETYSANLEKENALLKSQLAS
ncbi:hypothetical protein Tco_0451285 [Tanacetum coccineum]